MAEVYDDGFRQMSKVLADVVREREPKLDILDLDATVRRLLRRVGLGATQDLYDGATRRPSPRRRREGSR